jgi:Transposase DDE domain
VRARFHLLYSSQQGVVCVPGTGPVNSEMSGGAKTRGGRSRVEPVCGVDGVLRLGVAERGVRSYIPERRQKTRCWTNKPVEYEQAFRANHRRVRGQKGRRLNRWRSEQCERTFAHVCETGGGRRSWLCGQPNVSKVHTLRCAAYNLGLLLRKVWGFCKPRNAGTAAAALLFAFLAWSALAAGITGTAMSRLFTWWLGGGALLLVTVVAHRCTRFIQVIRQKCHSLTGC